MKLTRLVKNPAQLGNDARIVRGNIQNIVLAGDPISGLLVLCNLQRLRSNCQILRAWL